MPRFSHLVLAMTASTLLTTAAQAATFVYVSTGPDQQIKSYQLAEDGSLASLETIAVGATTGAQTVDSTRKLLFASLRSNDTIASFAIDPATGRLSPIDKVQLEKKANAAFLRVDGTGRWLVSASYTGGRVVVHRLHGGKIDPVPVDTMLTRNTAHCVTFDLEQRYAYVPHVAANAIYQFPFDTPDGTFRRDATLIPGGTPTAGPRHIVFSPSFDRAFTSDETGSSITSYAHTRLLGLEVEETLSTLPSDAQGMRNTTAEVKVHPSGKFVWVSNRGHDSLAGFAISEDGLKPIGHTPTEKTTRSFDIDPSGRFLVAGGEGSGKLAVYRINTTTGALERLQTYDSAKAVTWVQVVSLQEQ